METAHWSTIVHQMELAIIKHCTFHLEDNGYNSYQWIRNNIRLFC